VAGVFVMAANKGIVELKEFIENKFKSHEE
jgi:hypothetical protein